MQRRGLGRARVDIIAQDEFHYDFLIELAPTGRVGGVRGDLMGALTAVAVWPGKPTADELLQRRVQFGWRPTLTPLQSGPAVLGHAACLTAQACPMPAQTP